MGSLMVPKRHFTEGEGSGSEVPGRESRRRLGFSTVVRDLLNELSEQEFALKLEPFIRKVVREEVERKVQAFFHSSPRSPLTQIESSGSRAWQLHFQSKLPSALFTGSSIESEDGEPVKLIIVDANSKKMITSGPLSSIKIDIVALDGDFGIKDEEDWSVKDFNANIVHEREGKRPLVTGDLVVTLTDGVGFIGDISFTDNSRWVRCRKFRLGARVQSISMGERIREARSEGFVVKDHRGESYKKHHPPSLGDEIWRLEKISKDGVFHRKLSSKGISTVKDFLQLHVTDPSTLRNILGGRMSNKTWGTIIEHASACVLDEKLYMYYRAADSVGLVFNSIFKVVRATFDGQNYQCIDNLNPFQMRLVEDLKRQAYTNLDDLVPIDEPSVTSPLMLFSSLQASSFSIPSLDMQDVNIPIEHEGFMDGSYPLLPIRRTLF
ncbi:hypothetical protein LguiA_026646 [Lonicera macranthoides]